MMKVYFDNAATTPMAPEVLEAMLPYMQDHFGNPSAIHAYGRKTRAAVEQARRQVAALLNCAPGEIIFTSGGTEADNMVLGGAVRDLAALEATHPALDDRVHGVVGPAGAESLPQARRPLLGPGRQEGPGVGVHDRGAPAAHGQPPGEPGLGGVQVHHIRIGRLDDGGQGADLVRQCGTRRPTGLPGADVDVVGGVVRQGC